MSFSMLEPEEPPACECKYVEARDEMDRDDCPFHCDLPHSADAPLSGEHACEKRDEEGPPAQRKQAAPSRRKNEAA
jgi:hypothetical protein